MTRRFNPSLKTWLLGSLIVGILLLPGLAFYKFIVCYPHTCSQIWPFTETNTSLITIILQDISFISIVMLLSLSKYLAPTSHVPHARSLVDKSFGLPDLTYKQNLVLLISTLIALFGTIVVFMNLIKTF